MVKAAVGVYCDSVGKKLEAWAKNPPYGYNPKAELTEKQLIIIKTLAKKGKLRRNSSNKVDTTPNTISDVHYKWHTRTGDARKTIQGGFKWENENKCVAYVSGNMPYSVYLELAFEKQYAVLYPAVKALEPQFAKGMDGVLGR